MNRQQRRKQQRQQLKGEKVVNLKAKDVQLIQQQAEKKAINDVFALCLNVVALNLHDKLGFGTKRTREFIIKLLNQFECIGDNYLNFGDVRKIIKDEMGIEIESTGDKITVITK